jgi:hypothetical protein
MSTAVNKTFENSKILPPPNLWARSLGAALIFSSTTIGMLLNSFLLVTILSKRELRQNQINIILVSLLVDSILGMSLSGYSIALSYALGNWPGPFVTCQLIDCFYGIAFGSIMWHYTFISLHRYLFLVYTRYRLSFKSSRRRYYIIFYLITARLLSLIVFLPKFINFQDIVYIKAELRCNFVGSQQRTQTILPGIFNLFVPSIVIVFCFIQTFMRIRSASSHLTSNCILDARDARVILDKYQTNNNGNQSILKTKIPQSNRTRLRSSINKMYGLQILVILLVTMPNRIVRILFRGEINSNLLVFVTFLNSLIAPVSPLIIFQVNLEIKDQSKRLLKDIKRKVFLKLNYGQS